MRVPFAHLDRARLDLELSPSRFAKDPWGTLARHAAETAALAADPALRVDADIAYGDRPRQRLDLFRPAGAPEPLPCLVHLHGGFWQEGDKSGSGYAARSLTSEGWAMAGVGYTLAPEATLAEIVAEAGEAVAFVAREAGRFGIDPRRIVVSGHSAGGHLAAALLCGMGGDKAAEAIAGLILISGVFDLEPIAASYVNDRVGLQLADVAALSPLLHPPRRDVPVQVLVGAGEPEAFLLQSRALVAAWRGAISRLTMDEAPGRDHFDVLDELADAGSPTRKALREMFG